MMNLAEYRRRSQGLADFLRAYACRSRDRPDDPSGFVLGLSTRKSAKCCWVCLGRPVSPATVSRGAQNLDAAVAAFHTRQLKGPNKALMLDGVVLARKTGDGTLRRRVLVALGLRVGVPRRP